MPTTGYSDTPLLKKLGIKPGMKIFLLNPPENYFQLIETDIHSQLVKAVPADFVHLFATEKSKLAQQFISLIKKLPETAVIWVSWYKKSAKISTDITEDTIREIVLPTGWVDIKVCAVSDIWSGLKIVNRKS